MRLPVSRYGLREVVLLGLVLGGAALAAGVIWPAGWPWVQVVLLAVLLGGWAFFRDPQRQVPQEAGVLLSPADGTVTDILEVEEPEFIGGRAKRIGIFLSVFDVHLNRAPCEGEVAYIKEHPGKCLNALRAEAASRENQANCVGLTCSGQVAGKVMVKQITGAIARRIVCGCRVGDRLAAGQRFGMIKFGSRTELFWPVDVPTEVAVQKGQKVRAGVTVLVRYRRGGGKNADEIQ